MSDAPTRRFTSRVDDYVKYRPDYPAGVLEILRDAGGLTAPAVVADIGSGTGIASKLFLDAGHTVYGVEPNAAMRAAGEQFLAADPRFHSIAGTAEATTLPDASVDGIIAAQAFHWFETDATRREFARILRPGGWCALLWNSRHLDTTPFLRDYEALLLEFGTDYAKVRHENIDQAAVAKFFGSPVTRRTLPHSQVFDFAALKGRLMSSSYAPGPDHPRHAAMLAELQQIFGAHVDNGCVKFEYDTEVYVGKFA